MSSQKITRMLGFFACWARAMEGEAKRKIAMNLATTRRTVGRCMAALSRGRSRAPEG